MLFVHQQSIMIDGIEIQGTGKFLERTQEALALLRRASQFEMIQAHIAIIRQGKRSGMKAWAKKPSFTVGKATWNHSVRWYAGAIAHDAYHAKLYHEAKPADGDKFPDADAWTGVAAEKKCLAFQRQVLTQLDVDEKTLAYLDECAKNPTYQGRHRGWKSWLDYLQRWW